MRSFIALSVLIASVFAAPLSSSGLNAVGGAVSKLGLKPITDPVVNGVNGVARGLGGVEDAKKVDGTSLPNLPNGKGPLPPAPGSPVSTLTTRDCLPSIACVLQTLSAEIQPLVVQLNALNPTEATVEIVTPIVASLKASILVAVGQLQALVGSDVKAILVDVNGAVVTVEQLAKIILNDLTPLLQALAAIVKIVETLASKAVLSLLTDVLLAVYEVLVVVVKLDQDIVISLGPLLAPFAPLIECLGVTDILALLKISA
ncbi:hypothetical protein ID866_5350 [Astraeus odoratus]|nr:hypothetical protein ID866_5350 [Astraeus odoratus]